MNKFWIELKSQKAKQSLYRLLIFAANAYLFINILVPLVSSYLYNRPFEGSGTPNLKLHFALDTFISNTAVLVLLMELSHKSIRVANFIWALLLGFFLLRLPLANMTIGILPSGLWSPERLQTFVTSIFPTSTAPIVMLLLWLIFPISVGLVTKRFLGDSNHAVACRLTPARGLKLAVLFISPFVLVAGIVLLGFAATGMGAMIPFFLLTPWIYILTTFSIVSFIALVVLRMKSDAQFNAWFVLATATIPFLFYVLNIQFKEEYTNSVSLIFFGGIVFVWRRLINSILVEETMTQ